MNKPGVIRSLDTWKGSNVFSSLLGFKRRGEAWVSRICYAEFRGPNTSHSPSSLADTCYLMGFHYLGAKLTPQVLRIESSSHPWRYSEPYKWVSSLAALYFCCSSVKFGRGSLIMFNCQRRIDSRVVGRCVLESICSPLVGRAYFANWSLHADTVSTLLEVVFNALSHLQQSTPFEENGKISWATERL